MNSRKLGDFCWLGGTYRPVIRCVASKRPMSTPWMVVIQTLLVDWDWSTVGTANFDYRSFFINYELNLLSSSGQLNSLLARVFELDLQASREIEAQPWRARPLRGRLAEFVGWSARHWL